MIRRNISWRYKYIYLNNGNMQDIIDFVNEKSPSGIEGVQPMLVGGNEFNIWVREDHSGIKYQLMGIPI